MKRFRVRIIQEVEIAFTDERATDKSARYVAERCWTTRAMLGEFGSSRNVGNWETKLERAEIEEITEIHTAAGARIWTKEEKA